MMHRKAFHRYVVWRHIVLYGCDPMHTFLPVNTIELLFGSKSYFQDLFPWSSSCYDYFYYEQVRKILFYFWDYYLCSCYTGSFNGCLNLLLAEFSIVLNKYSGIYILLALLFVLLIIILCHSHAWHLKWKWNKWMSAHIKVLFSTTIYFTLVWSKFHWY